MADNQIENAHLHDYVFHYNIFTETWAAIPRDLYLQYWSKQDVKGVLRSSSLDTLLSLLHKTKGDETKIRSLLTHPPTRNATKKRT